jgi:hypothetical protein
MFVTNKISVTYALVIHTYPHILIVFFDVIIKYGKDKKRVKYFSKNILSEETIWRL